MAPSSTPVQALPAPSTEAAQFRSSRWTAGNLIFPDRLLVMPGGLLFRKRSWFSWTEERIPWEKVASVSVARGILFGTLLLETSGGTRPIVINGLWGAEAERARDLIASHQGSFRGGAGSAAPLLGPGADLVSQVTAQTALLEEMVRLQREVLDELRRR